MGAARDVDINSANSQFFINVVENTGLNGRYTVYGKVYEGMDVVDNIVNSPTVPGTERPQQKIEMFVTSAGVNSNIPNVPSLISPEDGLTDVAGAINFQWNGDAESVLYHIQFSTDSNFTQLQIDTSAGRNSIIIGNFDQGQIRYFWRVRSNNGAFLSNFSSIRSFTTGIAAPLLISPPDSSINISTNPQFQWNPVNGAQSYRLQVATSAAFFGTGLILNESGITTTSYSITGLLLNKKYFWRVRGITPTYEGIYSAIRNFTTTSTVDVNDVNNGFSYSLKQNFPNPFNPSTSIKYSLNSSQFVTLKVFNVLGSEIATLVNEEKPAGNYEIDFNPAATNLKLTSGIYFYKLTAGSFIETKKMILLK